MFRWIAPVLVVVTFLLLLAIGFWQARKHLPNPNEFVRLVETELTRIFRVPVKVESVQIGFSGAIIKNLKIQPDPRSPTGYTLTVPQLRFRWSLRQILRPSELKQFVQKQIEQAIHQVTIANATFFLWRDRKGVWNIQPLIAQRKRVRTTVRVPTMHIRDSTLIWDDETLPLPNGLPFRLKLVNVQATVEPIELGTRITAKGQLEPPLGMENNQANLTIVQVKHETFSETHGRIVASGLSVTHLPERLQSFAEGRVKLIGGIVSTVVLNWHQMDETEQISGTADLNRVPIALNFSKQIKFKPVDASLSFALNLRKGKVFNWHLAIRTTKPHKELGFGLLAFEGMDKFLRIRWSGENFALANLHRLSLTDLPISGGSLSGSVLFELEGKGRLIDADLEIGSSQFLPTSQLQRFRLPAFKLSRANAQIRLEQIGKRWQGKLFIAAKSEIGQGKARIWLNGKVGRVEAEITNLQVEPFKPAIFSFVPSQFQSSAQIGSGFVSGTFSVSWKGQKFSLERMVGSFHQIAVESKWSPPVTLSGQVQMEGKNLRFSKLNVRLDKNAVSILSGQATLSKQPIWQVEGQIPSGAIERLMAWAKGKWNLPVHLLRGGQAQIGAGGFGTQWQAQILWNKPSGVLNFGGLKWQGNLSQMSLLAATQGATAKVSKLDVSPEKGRIAIGKSEWQFFNGIQFNDWSAVWDEKSKSLNAYGSVKFPQVEFDGLPIREGSADLELFVAFSEKPKFEFRAFNLAGNFPDGSLVDGQVLFTSSSEAKLSASLKLRGFGLAQLAKLLKKHSETVPNFDGRFNGELVANVQLPSKVQLAFWGEIVSFKIADENKNACASKVILTALGAIAERKGEDWKLLQIAGDGFGREISVSLNGKKLFAEFAQVQGLAKQMRDDWCWDLRVHKVRSLNGTLSGQGKGNPSHAEANLSFAEIDLAQLLRIIGLMDEKQLLEGKGSGWLKLSTEKRRENWHGEWEGAILISEGKWQDWSVKMAGSRAHGQLVLDKKWNLQQLSGKFDGIQLLSEEGQAVLDGKFALRNGESFVSLNGKWAGVSLRRLSQRFDLPVKLVGLTEGTVRILWDGKWQVSGTVKSQGVAVGESAIWSNVSGEWTWDGNKAELRQLNATWDSGKLVLEGVIGTAHNFPQNLTIQSEDVPLADLSFLLREFQIPLSDWDWQGRVDGKIWLGGTRDLMRATARLKGQKVRLGLAELGEVDFDIALERILTGDKVQLTAKGIVNLQNNGSVATADFEGKKDEWQIRWRVGNLSAEILKAIATEWQNRQSKKFSKLDRWLNLPLKGNVFGEGYALIAQNQVNEVSASIRIPNLRSISGFSAQADLRVERKGKAWTINLAELRQGSAVAGGWVKIGDDKKLAGELAMNQISSELVTSVLTSLGIEGHTLPEGTLDAKIKLAGTLDKPEVEGTLQGDGVYWRGWFIRQVFVNKFEIRDGALKVEKGDGVIKWEKDAPLTSFWGQVELAGDGKVDWQVELPPTPLDVILPLEFSAKIKRSRLSGSIALQGKISEPKLKGKLELVADSLDFTTHNSLPQFVEPLTTIHNLRCQIEADGKVARLKHISANWAGGSIEGSGWFELGKDGLQNLFANKGELTLRVQGAGANLNGTNLNLRFAELKSKLSKEGLNLVVVKLQGNGFEAQGNVSWKQIPSGKWEWLLSGFWDLVLTFKDFRWQVKGAKGELSGTLALKSENENEPPILSGWLTLHDGDVMRLPVVASGGEGKWRLPTALGLALQAEIGDKFFLRNPQASLLLGGRFSVTGDLSQPRVEGELRSQRGNLKLPAAILTVTDMSVRVAYSIDPLTKQWVGTARMRVEGESQIDIHRVMFIVSGPIDAQSQRLGILPSVTLMAIPPLPEQKALERMFGLGLVQLGEALTNWQQLFSGVFVQSFMGNLLAPLTEPLAQALRWTELSVIREENTGKQWLRLGIPLAPKLHVLWRQGFSPSDPSSLEVQYYLGKRTSLTVIKKERERAEFRVQTSVRF